MHDSVCGGGRRGRDDWGYLFLLSSYSMVSSSWICPAWKYCQEVCVCFLWCFAQYCSRLPLCKINLPSIFPPYIDFNFGETSSSEPGFQICWGFCPYCCQWELLCLFRPLAYRDFWWLQCHWQQEWVEASAVLVVFLVATPGPSLGSCRYRKNEGGDC